MKQCLQKYHCVHFVLVIVCWEEGLHLSAFIIPVETVAFTGHVNWK